MTARGRFGPFLLLSLALHGAALAAVLLGAAPPFRDAPRDVAGVEILWDRDSPETVGGGEDAPPAPPAEPPPPPPAAAAPPPPAPPVLAPAPPAPPVLAAELPVPADTTPPGAPAPEPAEAAPDLPLPPPPAPPAPPRRAAPPRQDALAAAPAGLGRALGAVSPPAPDERFRNAGPPYPDAARRRGEQGQVLLELAIGTDGRVIAVQVVRSSGSPILDDAARRAALDWRFRPAQQDGQPVPATARTTVQFRLE